MSLPKIIFPATKVFEDTWNAINEKKLNEKGELQRLYKLIVQEGSSRSSKTWSDFQIIFIYNYHNPYKVTNVLRDTAIDCRDLVETEFVKWMTDPMNRLKEFEDGKLSAKEFTEFIKKENLLKYLYENKTKHIWTFRHNKSSIRFTGLDDEDKVMGMTQNVCFVNEPYNFSHEVYKQLSQRTSDFILLDWNPKKKHWIDEEKKRSNSIVLKSTFKDNHFCPEQPRLQILSYQPLSLCDAVTSGKILESNASGYDITENKANLSKYEINELVRCLVNEHERTASKYHWEVYGLGVHSELPNRIYRWETISLTDYHNINKQPYYYSDWGSADPWAVGEVKYLDGCLYVKELNYMSENEIRSKMTNQEILQVGLADEGIVTWMFNKFNVGKEKTIVCDSNRPNKIIALRQAGWEYSIAVQKKQTGPEKSSVIDGIDLLNNLKVYYTSDSENIDAEQNNYCRKLDDNGKPTDEPIDLYNHHLDGIRYVALFLQQEGIIRKI